METIGGLKLEGKLVENGVIDARAAADALAGFHEAFQHFMAEENKAFIDIEVPLPVEIRKGSWEAYIPTNILSWLVTAAGLGATTYITAAAKKLADNGFKDETLTTLAQKALSLIQELIKAGKHLGHLNLSKVKNVRWEGSNILIPNSSGEFLSIPADDWNKLARAPANILSKAAQVIEEERSLAIEIRIGGISTAVKITKKEKSIFTHKEEDETDIQFPELTHGLKVAIEGFVTRENGRTKTLGFLYDNHIITCIPASGEILPYKRHLFMTCRMHGVISRSDETGQPNARKPKIIFTDLEVLSDKEQLDLPIEFVDDDEA